MRLMSWASVVFACWALCDAEFAEAQTPVRVAAVRVSEALDGAARVRDHFTTPSHRRVRQ